MSVKERILQIRLAESISRQPEYAQDIGLIAARGNIKTRDNGKASGLDAKERNEQSSQGIS